MRTKIFIAIMVVCVATLIGHVSYRIGNKAGETSGKAIGYNEGWNDGRKAAEGSGYYDGYEAGRADENERLKSFYATTADRSGKIGFEYEGRFYEIRVNSTDKWSE